MLSLIFILSLFQVAQACPIYCGMQSLCNTDGFEACNSCPMCQSDGGGQCAGWCNSWTSKNSFCSGCRRLSSEEPEGPPGRRMSSEEPEGPPGPPGIERSLSDCPIYCGMQSLCNTVGFEACNSCTMCKSDGGGQCAGWCNSWTTENIFCSGCRRLSSEEPEGPPGRRMSSEEPEGAERSLGFWGDIEKGVDNLAHADETACESGNCTTSLVVDKRRLLSLANILRDNAAQFDKVDEKKDAEIAGEDPLYV